MTKKEIKKALEFCGAINSPCVNCPYKNVENCYNTLKIDALNLIIEQEKEIERLKEEKKQAQIDVLDKAKDLMDKYYVFEDVSSYFIDDFKELINEVQNDK